MFDATLDFHNFGKIAREEIPFQLDQFLELAYAEKHHSVLIITGQSGTVVRSTVLELLKKHPLISSFHNASHYDGGRGAFEVYLKD